MLMDEAASQINSGEGYRKSIHVPSKKVLGNLHTEHENSQSSGLEEEQKIVQRMAVPFTLSHLFSPLPGMKMSQQEKIQKHSPHPKICSIKKIILLPRLNQGSLYGIWYSTVKSSGFGVLGGKNTICLIPCTSTLEGSLSVGMPHHIHRQSPPLEGCRLEQHTYPVAENCTTHTQTLY